ncbi:protein translocase subunit SecD [Nonomuraea sp. NPDC050310]|uniref:protein translocase subunit SecD n=1 Tax=Nonomuraea sp. NPDC050310 TaxID=3154935 RepID=UPI0033D539C3
MSVWRAVMALAVTALSLFVAFTMSPRLGLDLRGGTQIVFEAQDGADAEAVDRARDVLARRADALGVADPTLVRSGERRIIVELPGVLDPREAAEVIGKTAQLSFHPVLASGGQALTDEDGRPLSAGPAVISGDGVTGAEARTDPQRGPGWFVTVDFREPGPWQRLTGEAACQPYEAPERRVAIVLDGEVISSPMVGTDTPCRAGQAGGATTITGQFTAQQAEELAVLIKGGALPVPLEIVEQRTVGPTLGAAAIEASAQAGVIGLALTALFIVLVYRLTGLLAAIALGVYGLLSYAALVALGATLTLPGLAGFVLAIGMAVDANVLVFERAREEYGKAGLRRALDRGFGKAWSAIADSGVTTLLSAGLLFWLASGPVKGFGVTLSLGVLASLVSAMVITRVLAQWAAGRMPARWSGLASPGRLRTWLAARNPFVLRRGRLWLGVAGLMLVVAFAGLAVRGLNFGVEFTGGRVMEFATAQSADAARQAVSDVGFPNAVVQAAEGRITVRTGELGSDEAARIGEALGPKVRDELIGPSLGAELRQGALIALGVALAAQLLYLAIRFRWTLATAAVTALFVDAAVVLGAFAWLGKPIDGVFLAAMLTVIGYSVNDKVVVFDRVRELRSGKEPFRRVVNTAILQTVPRTVNTGLGALFILAALAVLGGDSLRDFAIALLIGIVTGTLSSCFVAGPMAIELEARAKEPAPVRPREKVRPGAVV